MKVLFLCTQNSCRSILAEAALNHLAPDGVQGYSAGSFPSGMVHPRSLETLRRKGVNRDALRSKSWDELEDLHPDVVITVCDKAAGETCPVFFGPALKAHWGMPDPATVTGTEEEIDAAFESVFERLSRRIEVLLEALKANPDQEQLQATLKRLETL